MIRLPVSALEPGMVLAAPIPHPADPDQVLLNTDFRFDSDMIRQLRRFPVYYVWIRHPGFDFMDERVNEAVPRSRIVLYESVKKTFTGVADRTTGAFNLIEYRTVVGNMIFTMISNRSHAVWAERIMQGERELFGHSANVAYLSLLIGLRIKHYLATERKYVAGFDAEDLTNLGIGAMFHDFGKLGFDVDLQRVHVVDATNQQDEYRTHPERGYRALRGRMEATAAAVVLQHHQRFDGEGFPEPSSTVGDREVRRLEGRRIHIFARVVGVANLLEALINQCQQTDRPVLAALVEVQSERLAGMFDPVVLDAAVRCIPPFALSSVVELSDGRRAVVTDLNNARPCRPIVRVLPPPGVKPEHVGEQIDLSRTGAPTVVADAGRPVSDLITAFEARLTSRQASEPLLGAGLPDPDASESIPFSGGKAASA